MRAAIKKTFHKTHHKLFNLQENKIHTTGEPNSLWSVARDWRYMWDDHHGRLGIACITLRTTGFYSRVPSYGRGVANTRRLRVY